MNETIGCLIIHGFAGNTSEVEPLSRYLSSKGFLTVCPQLEGHTGNKKDLSKSTYKDWIQSVEEELLNLHKKCKKVIIIGFSMGGLIAIDLASRHSINGIAALNTPIYYWDISKVFSNISNDFKTHRYANINRYRNAMFSIPFSALINFRILLQKSRPKIRKINCPAFIAQGLQDDTVRHESAEYIFKYTSSQKKTIKYYKNSGHIICLDVEHRELFADVETFIEAL